MSHVHEQPRRLAEVAPNLPPALEAVVMQALATDPARRYPGADDFAMALADAALASCGAGWVRSGLRYTFQIFDNAHWNILKIGTTATILRSGTDPVIHRGSVTNTILGQCTETVSGVTDLVMTVNGKRLASLFDSEPPGPYLWHGALTTYRSAPSPGTEIRFNYFRSYQPAS